MTNPSLSGRGTSLKENMPPRFTRLVETELKSSEPRRRHGCAETMLNPVAVVDIGSNSVRLVVYEGAVRAPTPLFNEKVLCGLGRSVATTGRLGADAVERALRALRRFRALIDQTRRQARSRPSPRRRRARPRTAPSSSPRPSASSTRRSACCPAPRKPSLPRSASCRAFTTADGFAGDLGGGSLELIDVRGGRLSDAATLPLGGLRLIDASGGNLKKARDIVDAELAKVDWLEKGRGRDFYAIGGTWRALARLHMTQTNYPLSVMHNYRIDADDALKFAACSITSRKARSPASATSPARGARPLPYGALVLERLIKQMKPRAVVVSVFGIREGLLYSLLSEEEQRKDPLLAACDDFARQPLALDRQRLRAVLLDRCPVPRAGSDRDAGAAAAASRGLPALRYRLARASRLSRHAEPEPRRPWHFRRRRPSGPRVPRAHRLLPQRGTGEGRAQPEA